MIFIQSSVTVTFSCVDTMYGGFLWVCDIKKVGKSLNSQYRHRNKYQYTKGDKIRFPSTFSIIRLNVAELSIFCTLRAKLFFSEPEAQKCVLYMLYKYNYS